VIPLKATKTNSVHSHTRVPLQDVIPLEAPFSISIDPLSVCNQTCNSREIQKTHLRGERHSLDLYAKCGIIKYSQVDDINDYATELLHKLGSLD
jgi:hypothetical protein